MTRTALDVLQRIRLVFNAGLRYRQEPAFIFSRGMCTFWFIALDLNILTLSGVVGVAYLKGPRSILQVVTSPDCLC